MGDARLTLAAEPAGQFDYLLIDAFSSDVVPVHLLTVEALRMYLERVSERGILAIHISNRNVDLAPVIAANIDAIGGLVAVHMEPAKTSADADPTRAVLIARHAEVLAAAYTRAAATHLESGGVAPWTDDFSNVLAAVVRKQRDRFRAAGDPGLHSDKIDDPRRAR